MLDKITKVLSELSKSDLKRNNKVIKQISMIELEGLDIKC